MVGYVQGELYSPQSTRYGPKSGFLYDDLPTPHKRVSPIHHLRKYVIDM